MLALIRVPLLAFALLAFAGTAALAQQAPASPAPAKPLAEDRLKDVEAMVQQLRSELRQLTESAREALQSGSPVVLTTEQLVAIAAGAVAGAVVIDLVGGGGLATLAGATIGGIAGNWLYTQPTTPAP